MNQNSPHRSEEEEYQFILCILDNLIRLGNELNIISIKRGDFDNILDIEFYNGEQLEIPIYNNFNWLLDGQYNYRSFQDAHDKYYHMFNPRSDKYQEEQYQYLIRCLESLEAMGGLIENICFFRNDIQYQYNGEWINVNIGCIIGWMGDKSYNLQELKEAHEKFILDNSYQNEL